MDIKWLVELVSNLVRAVLARRGRVVDNVTCSAALEEARHVLPACLTRWRTEAVELALGTHHWQIVQFRRDETGDEASEGIELVEPGAPEAWDLWFRDCHTAKEGEDDDDEWVEKHGDEGAGREGGDGLAEGDGEELGDQGDEEEVAGAARYRCRYDQYA